MRHRLGNRSMARPARNNEHVTRSELNRLAILELDPESAVPAQKQLVLLVLVPWELSIQAHDPHDRVIDGGDIEMLPGSGELGDGAWDGNHLVHWRRIRVHLDGRHGRRAERWAERCSPNSPSPDVVTLRDGRAAAFRQLLEDPSRSNAPE